MGKGTLAASESVHLAADQVPDEWRLVSLGEIAEHRREGIEPGQAEDLRYVGLEHIDSGAVRLSRWGSPEDVRSTKFHFYPGDILYAKLRPYLDKGALAESEGICSTDILVVAPTDEVDPYFLAARMHSRDFLAHASATMTGVNHPRTSWSALRTYPIVLPPLQEQEAIAFVLRSVQHAKEATEKVIASTRELKRTLMRHLFRYGSVSATEVEQVELHETQLGPLRRHWKYLPFGDVLLDGTQNGIYKARSAYGEGTLIADMVDVFRGDVLAPPADRLTLSSDELQKYLLHEGDLLFARRSFKPEGAGKCQLVPELPEPTVFSSSIIRTRPDPSKVHSRYLMYLFTSPLGRQAMSQIIRHLAVSGVSGGDLKRLAIPVPPLEEQNRIAADLLAVDHKLVAEENRRSALQQLFHAALKDLVTGRRRLPRRETAHA